MSTPRTPAAKADHDRRKLIGTKRPHDNDKSRRGFFAGLLACHPKDTPEQLAALFNKEYPEETISERTVRRWRELYRTNKKDFEVGERGCVSAGRARHAHTHMARVS